MRIGMFVGTALPKVGGAEIVVDRLARHWTRLGADVRVLAPRPALFDKPDDSRYPYEVVRHPPFLSSRFGVEWHRRYLLAAHRTRPFDVVHCHGIFPHGYLAATCKDVIRAPLVFTSHGGDVGPDDRRYGKPAVRRKILWAMSRLDAMVSISEFTRRGFERLCPKPRPPIVRIPNGVDAAEYAMPVDRPADLPEGLRHREFLLFLGRLSRRKGVDVLLEALRLLEPPRTVDVAIAGDGEERPDLERMAGDLPPTVRVHFLGIVSGDAKRWLLQNALCTVMPSRGWEAFPLVLLESLAAGAPVLASDADGLGELASGSGGGVVFAADSPLTLKNLLSESLNDQPRLLRLGRFGQAFAQSLDWSAVAQAHLRLFESLIRGEAIDRMPMETSNPAKAA